MLFNIVIFSFLAGFSTIFGVYLVRRFESRTKKNVVFLISFAIGVLFATAFFNLLPTAVKMASDWPYWTLGAIFLLFLIEHFVAIHSCREENCEVHSLGITSLLGIGFHSLIDGIIIGVGFEASPVIGTLTALSMIFHKTADGIFTYSLLTYDKISKARSLFLSSIIALATPFAAFLTFLFIQDVSPENLGRMLAVAAGSFIYLAASDLIPETHRKSDFLNIILILVGIIFVLIIENFLK